MTTMLERAARALCGSIAGESRWDKLNESARRSYCKHARAVLMAVRSVDLESPVANAGWGYMNDMNGDSPDECFAAMIDAIMNEETK